MITALTMAVHIQRADLAAWGDEALQMIRREYYLPATKLYAERPDKKQHAFNWGVGVMLSALNAAAKCDKKYKPWLREFADASRVYWNDGGYDVLPAPKPKDRYYDDNAWMALALIETHEVLGDKKYLDWAKGALDFALSGKAKDGGIFWRESDKASRNTCSTVPTTAACLEFYRGMSDTKQQTSARDLFTWVQMTLRDPSDGLIWDSIDKSGKIDKTKWSYNTALYLRAYKSFSFSGYLHNEAIAKTGEAAISRWLRGNTWNDPGRFAHLLLENLIRVGLNRPAFLQSLRAVRDARSAAGFYPSHWSTLKVDKNPELLDQAAFARACFVLANSR